MDSNSKARSIEIEAIKQLLGQVQHLKVFTPEEERDYIRKAQAGDARATNEVVSRNLRLVVREAKKFMGRGYALEDLVQEGVLGLMRAIEKFDLDRIVPGGTYYKFSTYAVPWIKQPMYRAMSKKAKIVKIPDKELSFATAFQKVYCRIIETRETDGLFGAKPTSEECVEEFNKNEELVLKFGRLTVSKAQELGRIIWGAVYLDAPVGEEEDLSLVDYLQCDDFSTEEKAESSVDRQYIENLLASLTKEDSDFIKLKYGFADDSEKSDRQMAIILKIPIKEVKAKEARIIGSLKERSSMYEINTDILCNVVIETVPGDCYYEVFDFIYKQRNLSHTLVRCMLKNFPVTAFSKVNQHTASMLKEDLESRGAKVTITKFE